jgi:hypothetical protein
MLFRCFVCLGKVLMLGLCLFAQSGLIYADSGAGELNRLFTDRESRARMDAARKGDPVIEKSGEEGSYRNVRVDGVVIRENGDNVIWLNGESNKNSDKINGVHIRSRQIDRNNYRVPVRLEDKTVRLKPGQVWNNESGKVSDNY